VCRGLIIGSIMAFINSSVHMHSYITATICILLSLQTLYHLCSASYRDPGIVLLKPQQQQQQQQENFDVPAGFRWCDWCQTYQPPKAAHCPDCHVCIEGYDHHCVWMGTCIGKGNFVPFMRFNLSWLAYFIYAVIWVSVIAPLISKKHHP
jgi:hypothetical protein